MAVQEGYVRKACKMKVSLQHQKQFTHLFVLTFSSKSDLVIRISSAYPTSLSRFIPLPSLSTALKINRHASSDTVNRYWSSKDMRIWKIKIRCPVNKLWALIHNRKNLEGEYFVSNKCLGDVVFPLSLWKELQRWFSDEDVIMIWNIINKKLQYENDTM